MKIQCQKNHSGNHNLTRHMRGWECDGCGTHYTQTMPTEQATKELAKIWKYGGFSDAAMAIERCKAQSRAWNWGAANEAMREAYAALGAEAPEVAQTAIHCGEHPVQLAA